MSTWTSIANPSSSSWSTVSDPSSGADFVINAGEPIGLLIALTYANKIIIPVENWTRINNPSASSWTIIANPI